MTPEEELADMRARLRAIYDIAAGGAVPVTGTPAQRAARTPGCNCAAEGNPNPAAHAFGCPITPPIREIRTVKAL